MARPAIWQPPKLPGVRTMVGGNRANLAKLLGIGPGRTTPRMGAGSRAQVLGRSNQPGQQGNPYADVLANAMNQMRADYAAEGAADKGSMINAIRRYIISYGASPNFDQFGGLGKDAQGYLKEALDERTLELARKADAEGLSSRSRLQQANDKATRMIPAALAARGILRSGQTGADLADQAMQYKQSGYDMLNELMGGIGGSVANFQNAERERQRALAQAEMEAAWQAAQNWGDSYFGGGEDPGQRAAGLPGKPTRSGGGARKRPPKPGANFVWNGKKWVRKGGGSGQNRMQ